MLDQVQVDVQIQSLFDAVPSLWIALFEGLLHLELPDIYRDMEDLVTETARLHNAQILLSTLETVVLRMQLPHLKPELVVKREPKTMLQLTSIFWQIYLQLQSKVSKDPTDSSSGTPESQTRVLDIRHDDNPYMKALKLKQKRVLEERNMKVIKTSDRSTKQLQKVIQQHKQTLENIKNFQMDRRELQALKARQESEEQESVQRSEEQESIQEQSVEQMQYWMGDSVPERNLQKFIQRVRQRVPLKAFPTPDEQERIWKSQLDIKRRALDDRIWTQKVIVQQQIQKFNDETPLVAFADDEKNTRMAEWRRKQIQQQRKARLQLEDEYKRIKRMSKRQQDAQERVERQERKRVLQEQAMSTGIFKNYLKQQRQALIEERRMEKEARQQYEASVKTQKEAAQHYLNTQIQMLQEELKNATLEEKLLLQAQKQEIIRLVREQKDFNSKRIKSIHKKLESDYWEDAWRQDIIDSLKTNVRFGVVDHNTDESE
ncbi:hypothetical protein EDD86DRAFT_269743, partial [Gorgonomyces haynaldii]